ncbi:hypothetical protein ABZ468_07840 [Streptomyces sp. NPDC005708]|uniref:hypothetical protein n=1 Tax=Streptomyces sp. NPDC005708 TaxID=3154564 RepID=UPI00340B0662
MAQAPTTADEIRRLSRMTEDAFVDTVVHYVLGGTDKSCPRQVQGPALVSAALAAKTLDAMETAVRQARSFNPRKEGESKAEQFARIAPFRARLQAAMAPVQDVVDDLAHEEAKRLATLDDARFTQAWTAYVLDEPVRGAAPRRIRALAFRSPRVAGRAAKVCALMIEDPMEFLPSAPGESRNARAARVDALRRAAGSEARFLRYATQYAEARHGRMPSEPNIRLQALRLLGQAHPQELSQLLQQVRGEARGAKAEARRGARAVRRAGGQRAR